MASARQVQWVKGRKLGEGANGIVTFGTLKNGSSSTPVAVKSATGLKGDVLRRELCILNHLQGCPQIIRCYGGVSSQDSPDQDITMNLFLEYVEEGSLYDYLQISPMHECYARRYTRSMLRGLVHIHRQNVVHCDIKPANLLLWDMKEVRITDFGNAMWQWEENRWLPCRTTPYYLAPESAKRNEYGPPADVWALGCTVAEMLTGKPARSYLKGISLDALLRLIASGVAMPQIPEEMSEVGKDFLERCFEVDPKKRWTAEMLLQHPYAAMDDVVQGKFSTSTTSDESAWKERVKEIVCMARSSSANMFINLQHHSSSANMFINLQHHRPPPWPREFQMWQDNLLDYLKRRSHAMRRQPPLLSKSNLLERPRAGARPVQRLHASQATMIPSIFMRS